MCIVHVNTSCLCMPTTGHWLKIQPRVCVQRESFPFVQHPPPHTPLCLHSSSYLHTSLPFPGKTLTFALDLCSILQGAKPNEPRDTVLIPIIFLRIGLQICSLKVVCQAGEGDPINGEEGSREQPEKSGVRLTFWREPSTHSYY